MIYRDDSAPRLERLRRLRAQLARARSRADDDVVVKLRRLDREIAGTRRTLRRLRHPLLRLLPASLSELGALVGTGLVVLLVAATLCAVIAVPLLAFSSVRARCPAAAFDPRSAR